MVSGVFEPAACADDSLLSSNSLQVRYYYYYSFLKCENERGDSKEVARCHITDLLRETKGSLKRNSVGTNIDHEATCK